MQRSSTCVDILMKGNGVDVHFPYFVVLNNVTTNIRMSRLCGEKSRYVQTFTKLSMVFTS